ncbi:MAG: polyphosphate kinase 2, partial [Acidimicrobiia bacterium]|nr:polyphosphate kinase 2 [Acidimicrobiia bacterium]
MSPKRSSKKRDSVRRVSEGDRSPDLSAAGLEEWTVQQSTESACSGAITAVKEILADAPRDEVREVAHWLRAVLDGASPDDAAALRTELLRDDPVYGTPPLSTDDELASDWERPGNYPYLNLMSRKAYERQKYRLQVELLKLQASVKGSGERVVIIFEGRDAAGKGGTIKRFMEHLNPRGARVVALEKPTEAEKGQWYFQRYVQHLPTAGEIVMFDRSWYNRAGVERVMGFCSEDEYQEFLRQAPEF